MKELPIFFRALSRACSVAASALAGRFSPSIAS